MHIELRAITKSFSSVTAVSGATLDVRAGRVLALLGENGAGKSTLMKLLYGVHVPDEGEIVIDGVPVRIRSPREAMRAHIGMVFQHFTAIPALSVRENLALAMPDSAWWLGRFARRHRLLDDSLHALAPQIDPEAPAGSLPVGQLQLVELAKVMLHDAKCVILDEPSAVLTPIEAERLWSLVGGLAARGISVVLITHKIADVRACAHDVAVMRAGKVVAQVEASQAHDKSIVEWMVGEAPPRVTTPKPPPRDRPVRLELRDVSAEAARSVSLKVRSGEILGIAGISGSGQASLASAITGALALETGEILLDGQVCRARGSRSRVSPQLGSVPEEPLRNAVAPELSVALNLALRRLRSMPFLINESDLCRDAATLLARFNVRPADPLLAAGRLSGGNLQKLVAARELSGQPAAVIASYPTMGLDVKATSQVYEALFSLASRGSAVLWISEDLDDLLEHAHRIGVMHAGRIVAMLDARHATLHEIGHWMTTGSEQPTTDALRHEPLEVTA